MIQSRTVSFAKEVDDVMALFIAAVNNRKNKEELSKLIGDLMNALMGIDQVDDELAQSRKTVLQTVGFRTGELIDAFFPAQAVTPVTP